MIGVVNKESCFGKEKEEKELEEKPYKLEIVWHNVISLGFFHLLSLSILPFLGRISWSTYLFNYIYFQIGVIGITAGSHRLFTHRSYKATLPLRLFFAFAQTTTLQNSTITWCRDHRVHHKFAETDADPHNINRGFFFAHIGWLLCRKHPSVKIQGGKIDITDLTSDPILQFQHRHFVPLATFTCFILPSLIPYYFFQEQLCLSYIVTLVRHLLTLHITFCINSFSHMFGEKPYDVSIASTQSTFISLLAGGEGFHNYHHVFPQDYSASEWRYSGNLTTFFIDACCWVGLASDRKFVTKDIVSRRMQRTGHGTDYDYMKSLHCEKEY